MTSKEVNPINCCSSLSIPSRQISIFHNHDPQKKKESLTPPFPKPTSSSISFISMVPYVSICTYGRASFILWFLLLWEDATSFSPLAITPIPTLPIPPTRCMSIWSKNRRRMSRITQPGSPVRPSSSCVGSCLEVKSLNFWPSVGSSFLSIRIMVLGVYADFCIFFSISLGFFREA